MVQTTSTRNLLKISVRRQICGEGCVGAFPYFRRGILIEQIGDPEIALQFEMRPVIERIAQGIGNGSRPSEKFFVRARVARYIFFRDPLARIARHL